MTGDEFAGRSIIDLEAERSLKEDELAHLSAEITRQGTLTLASGTLDAGLSAIP